MDHIFKSDNYDNQTAFNDPRLAIIDLTTVISITKKLEKLSILYCNRGVLYFRCGNSEWAINDLNLAIEFNHLNHAAYFNLFSILVSNSTEDYSACLEGLRNLCCGLSCLYLMRGQRRNNEADVSKCVKYAENNCEGRLLRALQYCKKQKYSLALNQLSWVLDIEPSNLEILQIKSFISSKIRATSKGRYSEVDGSEGSDSQSRNDSDQNQIKRLSCTLYDNCLEDPDFNLEEEIQSKVRQFEIILKDLFCQVSQQTLESGRKLLTIKATASASGHKESIELKHISKIGKTQISQEQPIIEAYLIGSQSNQTSLKASTNSYLTLIAQDDQTTKISVKVGQICILGEQGNKELLYCCFEFGDPGLKLAMSTPVRPTGNPNEEDSAESRILKVKVFKKQILAFNDCLMGSGQVEIRDPGKYTAIIYNKSEEEVGFVEVQVSY